MATRTIEDDLRLELRLRLLPILEKDFKGHPEVDLRYTNLEQPVPGEDKRWMRVDPYRLLAAPRPDGSRAQAWVLSSEVGKGRTTLARRLAYSCLKRDGTFEAIDTFQGIFLMDGECIEHVGYWEVIKNTVPDLVSRWGAAEFAEWLEEAHVLIIVDDFVLDTGMESEIVGLLDEFSNAEPLLITSGKDAVRTAQLLMAHRPTLPLRLPGLLPDMALHFATRLMPGKKVELKKLQEALCLPGGWQPQLLQYPVALIQVCVVLKENPEFLSFKTLTEALWQLTHRSLSALQKRYDLSSSDLKMWVLKVGELCYECIRGSVALLGEEVEPALAFAQQLFPRISPEKIVSSLLHSRPAVPPSNGNTYCVLHLLQQQLLAGLYILHHSLEGYPMRRMLKRLDDGDTVAVFVAGHMLRMSNESEVRADVLCERAVRNLAQFTEISSDQLGYSLRLIHEMHSHSGFVQTLLKEAVFPRQMEVRDSAILADGLRTVLERASPTKIMVMLRQDKRAPQFKEVLDLLAGRKVSLALADPNHLEWGSEATTDSLLNSLIESTSVRLQDFIGCLSAPTLLNLNKWKATQNLVCLRSRARDAECALILLNCPNILPDLLWLEIDFDFPIQKINIQELPAVSTPLVDLTFFALSDKDIPFLLDFLECIRSSYSGLRMSLSKVSPRGVIHILKDGYKRNMRFGTDPKVIGRYRRYRFPELSYLEPGEAQFDGRVLHLIGYDDRHHYSDNEIRSTHTSDKESVDALKFLFESLEDLVFFKYVCANYSVIKQVNGTVEVKELV